MENSVPTKDRTALFQHLGSVLDLAGGKVKTDKKSDEQKIKWSRIVISAVDSYGALLRDREIEDLAKDIELIKKKIGLEP